METGFEVVAAQSKKTVYEDLPAQETMRGARKITSAPSTDQKKVRRQMTKKAAYEPNKVIHDHDDNTDMHTNLGAHQLREGDTLVGLNGSQISNVKHHGPYEAPNAERNSIPQTTFNYDHPSDPLWQGKDYQSPTYAESGFTVKRPCDGSCGKTAEGSLSFEAGIRTWDDAGFQQRNPQPGHAHAPQQRALPGAQPLQPRPPHEHNTRAFACKNCQGYGKDFFGNNCGRCRGTGLSTTSALDEQSSHECRLCGGDLGKPNAEGDAKCTECNATHHLQVKSALDDTKDCRTCGGKLSGQSGTVKCEECNTTHHLQTKSTAIARRAASLLNTPEENV